MCHMIFREGEKNYFSEYIYLVLHRFLDSLKIMGGLWNIGYVNYSTVFRLN